MAEPLPTEDQSAKTGFQSVKKGAAVMAALALAESALQPTDRTPLADYTEAGGVLTPVDGTLTIPLDGRVWYLPLTADIVSVLLDAPQAPECGSAVLYVAQDAVGDHLLPIPATWLWPDSAVTDIASAADAVTELVLSTMPDGRVIARATPVGVPA